MELQSPTSSLRSNQPNRSSPLLSLPAELRLLIYEHLFESPSLPLGFFHPVPVREELEPPLAQIPQLRHEVLAEFYMRLQLNIFKTPMRRNFNLELGIDMLGERNVRNIRHLFIFFTNHFAIEIELSGQPQRKKKLQQIAMIGPAHTCIGSRHVVAVACTWLGIGHLATNANIRTSDRLLPSGESS